MISRDSRRRRVAPMLIVSAGLSGCVGASADRLAEGDLVCALQELFRPCARPAAAGSRQARVRGARSSDTARAAEVDAPKRRAVKRTANPPAEAAESKDETSRRTKAGGMTPSPHQSAPPGAAVNAPTAAPDAARTTPAAPRVPQPTVSAPAPGPSKTGPVPGERKPARPNFGLPPQPRLPGTSPAAPAAKPSPPSTAPSPAAPAEPSPNGGPPGTPPSEPAPQLPPAAVLPPSGTLPPPDGGAVPTAPR